MKTVLDFFVSAISVYILCTFIAWDFSPENWSYAGRGLSVVSFMLVFGLFLWLREKEEDNK
jgi:hypothetical protein